MLRASGRNAEALTEFQRALALDKNFVDAKANLAVLMVTLGRKQGATDAEISMFGK